MSGRLPKAALMAWLLVAIYYFYQYALRSAPNVMIPQLTEAVTWQSMRDQRRSTPGIPLPAEDHLWNCVRVSI